MPHRFDHEVKPFAWDELTGETESDAIGLTWLTWLTWLTRMIGLPLHARLRLIERRPVHCIMAGFDRCTVQRRARHIAQFVFDPSADAEDGVGPAARPPRHRRGVDRPSHVNHTRHSELRAEHAHRLARWHIVGVHDVGLEVGDDASQPGEAPPPRRHGAP